MKRFVWVLVAVFCAALGQVQTVEPLARPRREMGCHCNGRCGMPGCVPPAPHAPTATAGERVVAVARPEAKRADPRLSTFVERFYAAVAGSGTARVARSAPLGRPEAASVVLFKAHCRLLI